MREGYLVVDDTSWQRFERVAEAVSWVWSASAGKPVWGMQVVLLLWTDGQWKVPVGLRLWRASGRSKVELAAGLLCQAHGRGLTPQYVLFDSWYAAARIFNLLDELGWKYVARLKSNRLLEGKALRQRWPQRSGHAHGRLRKVQHSVLVVKDGCCSKINSVYTPIPQEGKRTVSWLGEGESPAFSAHRCHTLSCLMVIVAFANKINSADTPTCPSGMLCSFRRGVVWHSGAIAVTPSRTLFIPPADFSLLAGGFLRRLHCQFVSSK